MCHPHVAHGRGGPARIGGGGLFELPQHDVRLLIAGLRLRPDGHHCRRTHRRVVLPGRCSGPEAQGRSDHPQPHRSFDWRDVDIWLGLRGSPTIEGHIAVLAYGANTNPGQLSTVEQPARWPIGHLTTLPAFGSRGRVLRHPRSDGQLPTGLVKGPSFPAEVHFLLLVDAPTKLALDEKEGTGFGTYDWVGLVTGEDVDVVLENGCSWTGALTAYKQGHRRPLAIDPAGNPVLVREVDQRRFMAMRAVHEVTGEALNPDPPLTAPLVSPGLQTAPLPVFVHGTLRPGQSRWQHVESHVVDHRPDSATGRRTETGLALPGLVSDTGSITRGTLLRVRAESMTEGMHRIDAFEGHPAFY